MASPDIRHGDCLNVLRTLPDASIDAICTDPPYELGFMGKRWDASGIAYSVELWAECLRVLKPGGHLASFGGTRTYHRMACAVEDAGFEIRDSLHWIMGSGFPKSTNVGAAITKARGFTPSEDEWPPEAEQWRGFGSALKPAVEPIVLARKPLVGTVAANVLAHGTGALNIDGTRVAMDDADPRRAWQAKYGGRDYGAAVNEVYDALPSRTSAGHTRRWPANVLLSHSPQCGDVCQPGCPVAELDAQSGTAAPKPERRARKGGMGDNGTLRGAGAGSANPADYIGTWPADPGGGASRFFPTFRYQAKAPTSERPKVDGVSHPTVKPLALMRWLVRLITPPGGVVLDPFAGSGTTVEAALLEGFDVIAVEREADYLPLIAERVARATPSVVAVPEPGLFDIPA